MSLHFTDEETKAWRDGVTGSGYRREGRAEAVLFPQNCTASHSKGVSFPSLWISQLRADGYRTGIWPRGFICWKWLGEIIHSFLREFGHRRKGSLKKLEETTSKVAEVEGLSDQLIWRPHLS